jgi:predicted GIY-YIG superfamily endonuclease
LLAAKKCRNRSKALREEYALKQLRRKQKVAWAGNWAVGT